ncbi:transposase [Streptomyces lateritius]|uniref:transposase n=1 Tax=Streptomyces lateritius TaxID=67313 RepID=UPI0016782BB6|nr:transposase [Streptomyces lateritius]GGU01543.1 hypothetical protein GCM10010272_53290 [Streptomyces lateritius]
MFLTGLWVRVATLLPARPVLRHRYPGRLPVPGRVALNAILYVLRTGEAWRYAAYPDGGLLAARAWPCTTASPLPSGDRHGVQLLQHGGVGRAGLAADINRYRRKANHIERFIILRPKSRN